MQEKLTYNNTLSSLMTIVPSVGKSTKWVWWLWCTALVVAFFIQLLTLDVLPHLQQDEAQITDYGRLALDPHSDWSVTWRVAEDKPLLLWSYIGPLIAEVSFQLGGPSGLGPRIASLLGGSIAATMALGWLLARRVPVYVAFGLSLAFLLDPLFVLSQRMARIDSWVIALCLAACWILHSASKRGSESIPKRSIMVAGALAASAALVWPSAIFLYPLVVLELVVLSISKEKGNHKWKTTALLGLYFFSGGLTAVVLLLLPVWESLVMLYNDMATMVTQNIDASRSFQSRLLGLFNYQLWIKMLKALVKTFSPLFPILALAGLIFYRHKGLLLASVITIAMIFATLVYEFRVLYLLPYFLALGSGIFLRAAENPTNLSLQKICAVTLIILMTWSVGTSLFLRTGLGLEGKEARSRSRIQHIAASSIGAGNYKVLLGFTYEFYFAGRALGWKVYTPYIQYAYDAEGNWIREKDYQPNDKFLILLSDMDFAVFAQGAITHELKEQLTASGLHYSSTLETGDGNTGEVVPELQSRNKSVLLWFLQGKESYGPYVLYSRAKNINNSKLSVASE